MAAPITRDQVKEAFAPMVLIIEEAVEEARIASSQQLIADSNPEVTRLAHRRRLGGTKRWMVLADGLVQRAHRLPEGYGLDSTEEDHNQGKYAFRFPLGLCTIRREPHNEDQGKYLQERIEGVLELAELAPGIDAFVGIKAYISVPPEGAVCLIATHPTLPEPMEILLDEIERSDDGGGPVAALPAGPLPTPPVGSTRKRSKGTDDENAEEA